MERLSQKELYGKRIALCCIAAIFAYITYRHIQYIRITKSIVPIMDYWKWIAVFGERVIDGSITFLDYFHSDAGEHIHPMDLAITFGVLNAARFDVVALVVCGLILRIVTAFVCVAMFLWNYRHQENNNYWLMGLCAIVMILSVYNHNQWEAITEPFALSFNTRIVLYGISFILSERLISQMEVKSKKRNFLFAGFLGLYCAALTILEGGAYFVGHLVGIGLGFLWVLICQWKKFRTYFWPIFIWGVISLAAACVYYVLYSQRGVSRPTGVATGNILLLLPQGVCYFWGALFIHTQSSENHGIGLIAIVGTLMLVYTIYITVRYLKMHRNGKGIFPAIGVLYALVLSVTISVGRVGVFRAQSMASSRYVVESSFALVCVVWMTYGVYTKEQSGRFSCVKPIACILAMSILLLYAYKVENGVAPYRGVYQENLYQMMSDLDSYSDEELGPFQANDPADIRYCVELLKENNLSIFSKDK